MSGGLANDDNLIVRLCCLPQSSFALMTGGSCDPPHTPPTNQRKMFRQTGEVAPNFVRKCQEREQTADTAVAVATGAPESAVTPVLISSAGNDGEEAARYRRQPERRAR